MWYWLSNSKVRLGLLVNGLYLLSLAVPSPRSSAPPFAPTYAKPPAARLRAVSPPDFAPLPPPAPGPLKAATNYWKHSGQLDTYLTRDLTLVRERGHTLLLSPTTSTSLNGSAWPRSVLLQFVAFSHGQFYDHDSPFIITADGIEVWRYGGKGSGTRTQPSARPFYSAMLDDKGQVVEALGHELPYDLFAQLIGARRVGLELGPERVELTTEQMEALREMHTLTMQSVVDNIKSRGR